jgi:hypothetical protein
MKIPIQRKSVSRRARVMKHQWRMQPLEGEAAEVAVRVVSDVAGEAEVEAEEEEDVREEALPGQLPLCAREYLEIHLRCIRLQKRMIMVRPIRGR